MLNTVEVFTTDIDNEREAAIIAALLSMQFPNCRITFDLEDREKVLRIEGQNVVPDKVISLVRQNGYDCNVME